MVDYRWAIMVAMAIGVGGGTAAAESRSMNAGLDAAAPDPVSAKRSPHRKRIVPAASRGESLRQYSHDFYSGTASQQVLERSDNEAARSRPIDHRKDDFFSDWKGLQ